MDPIHPILPTPPTFPPVAPAPKVQGAIRDEARDTGDHERRRRPPRQAESESDLTGPEVDDDGASHVDVTA